MVSMVLRAMLYSACCVKMSWVTRDGHVRGREQARRRVVGDHFAREVRVVAVSLELVQVNGPDENSICHHTS
jgi:hypothetical protein